MFTWQLRVQKKLLIKLILGKCMFETQQLRWVSCLPSFLISNQRPPTLYQLKSHISWSGIN